MFFAPAINIPGNAATATTAAACSGNAATATTAAACSGNAATSSSCSGAAASNVLRDNTNIGIGTYMHGTSASGPCAAGATTASFSAVFTRWNSGNMSADVVATPGTWRNVGNKATTYSSSSDFEGSTFQRIA